MGLTVNPEDLQIGQRVTMRYPSGILQEAVLIGNDDGILNFQFGEFVHESVGPVLDIYFDERGEWNFGLRGRGTLNWRQTLGAQQGGWARDTAGWAISR